MNLKSAPEGLCGLELDSMSVDNGGNCLSLFRLHLMTSIIENSKVTFCRSVCVIIL